MGLHMQSELVRFGAGGQAAKRYTAVYCDDDIGEYAGGPGALLWHSYGSTQLSGNTIRHMLY